MRTKDMPVICGRRGEPPVVIRCSRSPSTAPNALSAPSEYDGDDAVLARPGSPDIHDRLAPVDLSLPHVARRGDEVNDVSCARFAASQRHLMPGSRATRLVEAASATDSVGHRLSKGRAMAKATVEVLVDDLDGSEGAETIRLGWNGEWRELELSKRNLASLSRALDKYWSASRPVSENGPSRSGRRRGATRSRSTKLKRDPKVIRAWAIESGIAVPARGRIPGDVERQYNEANGRS